MNRLHLFHRFLLGPTHCNLYKNKFKNRTILDWPVKEIRKRGYLPSNDNNEEEEKKS